MGILNVLRRKRSSPKNSPKSGEVSTVNKSNEIDKENDKPADKENESTKSEQSAEISSPKSCPQRKQEASLDDSLDVTQTEGTIIFDETIADDDYTESSDEVALAGISVSVSDSTDDSSEAAAASVSEFTAVTEVSDDGILRDDEGNPIDPNEAEVNMLRDTDGNIIDPKTFLQRETDLDDTEEEDEYDIEEDASEEAAAGLCSLFSLHDIMDSTKESMEEENDDCNDPALLDIGFGTAIEEDASYEAAAGFRSLFSDSIEEGEVDSSEEPSKDEVQHRDESISPIGQRDETARSQSDMSNIDSCLGDVRSQLPLQEDYKIEDRRTTISSRRRKRRGGGRTRIEYVHVMFHNRLNRIEEESSILEEADDESLSSTQSMSTCGSFDEKFIGARWEYTLQITNLGSFTNNGVMVYARDEINDMLREELETVLQDDDEKTVEGEI